MNKLEFRSNDAKARAGRWRHLLIAGVLTLACFGASVGDTLYVGRRVLPIRSGKFAFDKVLATANQGDMIKVTGIDGRYLKVVYTPKDQPPVEGYVLEAALTPSPPETQPATLTGVAAAKGVSNNDLQAVAAGKGVLDSKAFASAKGLSEKPLEDMERESVKVMSDSDKEFMEFMKAGKIGLFKPNTNANQ